MDTTTMATTPPELADNPRGALASWNGKLGYARKFGADPARLDYLARRADAAKLACDILAARETNVFYADDVAALRELLDTLGTVEAAGDQAEDLARLETLGGVSHD